MNWGEVCQDSNGEKWGSWCGRSRGVVYGGELGQDPDGVEWGCLC